ncbi:hypothetical protein L1987_03423 [Smallanthus sonchifolius]|uniref:Uncharacterized protein n=1 Tax=Smallanthus sonchifolius TaxID=185202 RepID=A0ACB9KAN9_9ASTR|nr:hypothetical protein L1987_03423 [Smallanthus sonchifolius]
MAGVTKSTAVKCRSSVRCRPIPPPYLLSSSADYNNRSQLEIVESGALDLLFTWIFLSLKFINNKSWI